MHFTPALLAAIGATAVSAHAIPATNDKRYACQSWALNLYYDNYCQYSLAAPHAYQDDQEIDCKAFDSAGYNSPQTFEWISTGFHIYLFEDENCQYGGPGQGSVDVGPDNSGTCLVSGGLYKAFKVVSEGALLC